ncbi:MAG TPA: alpha/beta fold hydrolase [Acidimicrobiales bacterium]
MAFKATRIKVELDEAELDELAARLAKTRLPGSRSASWMRGTPTPWLAELVADWRAFDPGHLQDTLDRLDHIEVTLDGLSIHAVHAPGAGRAPAPLLVTHGWPSSFLEYVELLPLLNRPSSDDESPGMDGFSVVVPSLPGFGFSAAPEEGLTHGEVAEIWHRLMVDALGYERYFAHGSDLGAGVTARLARSHPESVTAIHLATPGLPAPPEPWSEPVHRHVEEVAQWSTEEGGYSHIQATKPSTAAAGLLDSPVGLAAWIGEKWMSWSSTTPDGLPAVSREHLLSTLTLYWVTRTAGSSMLPYWKFQHSHQGALPADDPAPTPTAIDVFGGETVPFPKPPKDLADRYFNVVKWAEHDSGGHFPALAEPHLLAQCLWSAFRPYRDAKNTPPR